MHLPAFARAAALALFVVARAMAQSYTFTNLAGQPPQEGSADGTGAAARFNIPTSVALDSAGNIFVTDGFNYTIRKITPAGVVSTFAGLAGAKGGDDGTGDAARFGLCYGLVVDSAGNIFVTDYDNHTIRKISPTRVVTTIAGFSGTSGAADGPGPEARFKNPVGIVITPDGTLIVGDRGNATIRKITPAGVVSTFVGSPGVGGTNDGTGSAARFRAISGLTLDPSGTLFVAENANSVIRKITPEGVVSTFAGANGISGSTNAIGTDARFNYPNAIVSDLTGNLFVADSNNHTIRRITATGSVTTIAGSALVSGGSDGPAATARFYRPFGLALDRSGTLIVADTNNQTIRTIATNGTVSTLAGPGGSFGSNDGTGTAARFYYPQGVALDRARNVFVTDAYNATVRKITPTGTVTTFAGLAGSLNYIDGAAGVARFLYPYGIVCDSTDTLYVTDSFFNTIRSISPAGLVRTIAGIASATPGSNDGAPLLARFNQPRGLAVDRDDNLYVADAGNHTIRKVTTGGTVSTLAGLATARGSADGSATAARFNSPSAVAVAPSGAIYVADTGNHTIRRIAVDGTVSTVAGTPGTAGSADGPGSTAQFSSPYAVALDSAGNLLVGDGSNYTIRKITPDGVVSTIGGLAGTFGSVAGTGAAARFSIPIALATDSANALYIVDQNNNRIVRGALDAQPAFATQPQSITVTPGSRVTFTAAATGGGLSYQWKFEGAPISGATSPTYTVNGVSASSAGGYTVEIANSAGAATSRAAILSVITTANVGRITNLAIRSQAGTAAQTLIVGVAIGGSGTGGNKPLLLRAVGPTLGGFGVAGALADPRLELYSGATKINENDDWAGNALVATVGAGVGAFALSSPTSKDAALYNPEFASGSYSVQITGGGGGTGVALAEIYDGTPVAAFGPSTPRLTNVSARTQVGTEGDILIAGFTIGGLTSKTVLIRAIGPTLTGFGVAGALADPQLALFSGAQKIDENDDWGGNPSIASTFLAVGAFPLLSTTKDAVLLVTLAPGSYTAQVSGANKSTGVALVEVYDVP